MFAVTIFGSFKPQVAGFGLWHRITKLRIMGSNLSNGFCNIMMVWPRSRATLPSQQTHNKYTYCRLEQNLGRHPISESGRI